MLNKIENFVLTEGVGQTPFGVSQSYPWRLILSLCKQSVRFGSLCSHSRGMVTAISSGLWQPTLSIAEYATNFPERLGTTKVVLLDSGSLLRLPLWGYICRANDLWSLCKCNFRTSSKIWLLSLAPAMWGWVHVVGHPLKFHKNFSALLRDLFSLREKRI